MQVPRSAERLVHEVDGWLDLGCAQRALDRIGPLLDIPGARPVALTLRIRALVELKRFDEALDSLDELGYFEHDPEWSLVTEAWCRKRTGDLPGAITCMRRLVTRDPRSAIGHYNLGCYLALAGQRDEAIDQVTVACGLDETYRKHAATEPDLDVLRNDERFTELLRH